MIKNKPTFLDKKISNPCLNTLKETESYLGIADTLDLMSNAFPLIVERKNMINLALQEGNFERAAAYAHKTIGSIRLYGTDKLEGLLSQLKEQQVTAETLDGFQAELSEEFDSVSFTVGEWLSLHRQAS